MNLIQMLVHLLKSVHGIDVRINMNGKEVDIADRFDMTCTLKLNGKTATQFIQEWNNI
jgi:hypothetical protein